MECHFYFDISNSEELIPKKLNSVEILWYLLAIAIGLLIEYFNFTYLWYKLQLALRVQFLGVED